MGACFFLSPWLVMSLLLRVLLPLSLMPLGPRSLMCPRSTVVWRLCVGLFPSPPFPSLYWLLLLLLLAAFCGLLMLASQVVNEALAPLLVVGVVRLSASLASLLVSLYLALGDPESGVFPG